MKLVATIAVTYLLAFASASSLVLEQDLKVSLEERPVMKVVRLLQDTKAELEKELEDDRAVHETMTCWCNSNSDEKTAAIAAANSKISELEATMGSKFSKDCWVEGEAQGNAG